MSPPSSPQQSLFCDNSKNTLITLRQLQNQDEDRTGYRWQQGESGGYIDSCQRTTEQFGTIATRESGGSIGPCLRSTEQFGAIATRESGRSIDPRLRSTEQFGTIAEKAVD